jgi:hypothetical protein
VPRETVGRNAQVGEAREVEPERGDGFLAREADIHVGGTDAIELHRQRRLLNPEGGEELGLMLERLPRSSVRRDDLS